MIRRSLIFPGNFPQIPSPAPGLVQRTSNSKKDFRSYLGNLLGFPTKANRELLPNRELPPNLESEFSGLRSYLLFHDMIDKEGQPREKVLSYLLLHTHPKSTDQRKIMIYLIANHIAKQLNDSGCQTDFFSLLEKKLVFADRTSTPNTQVNRLDQVNRRNSSDEPYWIEYVLSLPSCDKNEILIGKQYIFTMPSLMQFSGDSVNENEEKSKFLLDLYRRLVGDLAISKIRNQFLHGCQVESDEFSPEMIFSDDEIISKASYEYLLSLYRCNSLEEVFSTNPISGLGAGPETRPSKSERRNEDQKLQKLLYQDIGNLLWTRFQLSYQSEYLKEQQFYDSNYQKNFSRTLLCLVRSLDSTDTFLDQRMNSGNKTTINIGHFRQMLKNFS